MTFGVAFNFKKSIKNIFTGRGIVIQLLDDTSMFSAINGLYVEINGVKVGAIKSYNIKTICSSKHLDTLWGNDLAQTVKGNTRYIVSLTKLCLANNVIDFYNLKNFTLKIVKPMEALVFCGCEWTNMEEHGSLEGVVLEDFTLVSLSRTVD